MNKIHEFTATSLDGTPTKLDKYAGKVMLVVNTASKCGFTPQFKGLQKLYDDYNGRGLEILGFPCNQFGAQEPGSESEIGTFCQMNYGVGFPMFEKVDVNGNDAHPVYKYLSEAAPGLLGTKEIKWNFTKFLIDREGKVLKRYAPNVEPEEMKCDIEKLL